MPLSVTSEIGRLKRVLLHLPGAEIDTMVPSMMGELLFDDILFGNRAREEHRRFQQLVLYVADEVLEAQDLLEEVLEREEARSGIFDDLRRHYQISEASWRTLEAAGPEQLAALLVSGIPRLDAQASEDGRLLYDLQPLANLFFMRDPAVVCGDRVLLGGMASTARRREPLLMYYLYRWHPALASGTSSDQFWGVDTQSAFSGIPDASRPGARIEGGDVLVPREDLLIVGVSQRTNREAVETVAEALAAGGSPFRTLLVVEIPNRRSCMHLDTVFTIIDRGECLAYLPVIEQGSPEEAHVYAVDLGSRERSFRAMPSLLEALAQNGIDLRPISCGGYDPIQQQREQWTDGANAFALAPGVLMMYERNVRTAEELARAGYAIVYEDDVLLGRTELQLWDKTKKYAIQIEGHELSRARGGPRCMTQPLEREPL